MSVTITIPQAVRAFEYEVVEEHPDVFELTEAGLKAIRKVVSEEKQKQK